MKYRLIYVFILFNFQLLLMIQEGYCQKLKDTITINGITVSEKRLNPLLGLKTCSIDSLTLEKNTGASLSDLLSSHTSVFMKTYGQGGLATASFRGTSASHTPVLWNDVAINSPMLSQMDFSMLPVFFMDDIKLMYGGSSLINNSGGLGGSINIENKSSKEKLNISYIQQIGSFSTYGSYLDVGVGSGKFHSRSRLMFLTSANDFSYKNNTVGNDEYPVEIRKDAAYKQYGWLQEFYFQPKVTDELGVKLWFQKNERDIPQPLVVLPIDQNEQQKNSVFRGTANWKHYQGKGKLETSIAYIYDFLNYSNKIAFINSDNRTHTFAVNVKYRYKFSEKTTLNTGITNDYYRINSNNYMDIKTRNQLSAFVGATSEITPRLAVNAVVRKEVSDKDFQPFLPSLGIDYHLLKDNSLLLKAHISKNYHLPSLNDLYWSPGGNPELKPEDGFSTEGGVAYEFKKKSLFSLITEVTYFYTHITDWILWQPDPVFRYWTPLNLKEVNTQGLECNANLVYQLKTMVFRLNAMYSYTSARNLKPINQNDNTTDKQLIYTPVHSYNASLRAEWKTYFLSVASHFTGKRFTNTSNTRYMPAYQLTDLSLGMTFPFKNMNHNSFSVQLNVNNLFDIDYQAIAWQPMPGRNMEIQLKYNFKNK
ncbi:MAG: TonB-dependent receptor [Bacteroidetes bacterium]|nr:TonB-dependent receptor [Bacteroidota bacterium]